VGENYGGQGHVVLMTSHKDVEEGRRYNFAIDSDDFARRRKRGERVLEMGGASLGRISKATFIKNECSSKLDDYSLGDSQAPLNGFPGAENGPPPGEKDANRSKIKTIISQERGIKVNGSCAISLVGQSPNIWGKKGRGIVRKKGVVLFTFRL